MKVLNGDIETGSYCKFEFKDKSKNYACNCIGPQDGEPLCPCKMREDKIFMRDGSYVQPEKIIG